MALTALALPGQPASSQVSVGVRGAAVFESYDLSPSLDSMVDNVSELSVPLVATAQIGRRARLTLATGYARVSVRNQAQETSEITGLLDTKLRLEFQALRDRVTLFTTSSFPTATATLGSDAIPLLGVLASDVVGFAAPTLGAGGAVGGGIAVAVPVGGMALGLASSFSANGTYEPIEGQASEFRPGAELRVRAGIEGPVARRSFLRISGVFARRGNDEINGASATSIGNRFSGYLFLEQGLGSSTLVLYAFDMFRADAGLESTPVGTTLLNRGNVFVAGAQWSFPFSSGTAFAPRVELRDSRSEVDGEGSGLKRLGRTARFGADLSQRLGGRLTGVLRADGLVGNVAHTSLGGDADIRGYRLTLQVEAR